MAYVVLQEEVIWGETHGKGKWDRKMLEGKWVRSSREAESPFFPSTHRCVL